MITEHQELLELIESAEKSARQLYDQGLNVGGIVKHLRAAGEATQARIDHYKRFGEVPYARDAVRLPDPPNSLIH